MEYVFSVTAPQSLSEPFLTLESGGGCNQTLAIALTVFTHFQSPLLSSNLANTTGLDNFVKLATFRHHNRFVRGECSVCSIL